MAAEEEIVVKRSRMPGRTASLRSATSLARSRGLQSSGPVKAKRRNTGPTTAVRVMVKERAGYRCEMCPYAGMDVHHRRPRALGGSSDPATNLPANLVFLCRECHSWIETHRKRALVDGWLVRQGHDPEEMPLLLRPGLLVLLTNTGHYLDITAELETRHA